MFRPTSGIGSFSATGGDTVTFGTHASFSNLARSTAYVLINLSVFGGGTNRFIWKSTNTSTVFANRSLSLASGKLFSLASRESVETTASDAEVFPEGIWMLVATTWEVGVARIYKAPYIPGLHIPLREVSYATQIAGSGGFNSGGFSQDNTRPWIVGDSEPTGTPSKATIQSFRVYNDVLTPDEIVRHQYEFGVAPGQVFNADFGRFRSGNVIEQVGVAGSGSDGVISGADIVGGIVAYQPKAPAFAAFAAAAGGDTLVGAGLTNSILLERGSLAA